MSKTNRPDRGYRIFIAVLVILLLCCIALFIYGSATNGVQTPRLPGKGIFALDAWGTMRHV